MWAKANKRFAAMSPLEKDFGKVWMPVRPSNLLDWMTPNILPESAFIPKTQILFMWQPSEIFGSPIRHGVFTAQPMVVKIGNKFYMSVIRPGLEI